MRLPILLLSVVVAPAMLGQESKPASRPTKISLPITEFATPFGWKDAIVVTVSSGMNASESRPSREFQTWRIESGGQDFPLDRAGIDRLQAYLLRLGKGRPGEWGKREVSERILLIRADADAAFGCLEKVMMAAAGARIYKLSYAAATMKGGTEEAFDWWLPRDLGPDSPAPEDAPRFLFSWNRSSNKLERVFGQTVIPSTKEGDARLEKALGETQARAPKGENVRIFICSGPLVPWQALVDFMSMARRAGVERAAFCISEDLPK